ncbi:MAG TPA: hypothetical protein VKA44_00805 [Gemmatimonadota bacterium]|nr:hypothetical protein [Gemmatimonadota bacterium]
MPSTPKPRRADRLAEKLPALALAAAVCVLAIAAPRGAAAQARTQPGDQPALSPDVAVGSSGGPELFAIGGGLAPLARLSSDPGSFATEVSSAPVVGGAGGYWLPDGLGLGVQVLYAPANLNVLPTAFQGPIPTGLGDARYLAATAELRYRLRPAGPAGVLAPYIALGGGIRRLEFDAIAHMDVQDTTDPVGTAALGVETGLIGPVAMRLELRDYVSSFDASATGESHIQNDVLITVGLGVIP